jgi:hypothetical protein
VKSSEVGRGELLWGACGVALLVLTFVPWYGSRLTVSGTPVPMTGRTADAWQALSVIDVVLLLVAIVAVAAASARFAGELSAAPAGLVVAAAGLLALGLIVFRILEPPAGSEVVQAARFETTRKAGPFLAALAAAGIACGGALALGERA